MRVTAVITFIFILVQTFDICVPARILCVFPFPSISHQVVFRALVEELAIRGHHIVTITADPLGDKAPPHYENVTEIDVHDVSYDIWKRGFADKKAFSTPITTMRKFISIFYELSEAQLSTPEVKSLIQGNETFDLVIAESLVPTSFAYAGYFKTPLIGISSMTATMLNFEAVGVPTHPLIYYDITIGFTSSPGFWNKVDVLKFYFEQKYEYYRAYLVIDAIARKHFGDDMPSTAEIESNMDMLFINANPILHGARPTVPAVVYMGNMHIKPKKKLPQDLQNLLDQSTQGVIYFSLGSNVKSKDLPEHLLHNMISALGELPYTVLWKFENETLQGKPDNVHISKWFPQRDLLGHPNIRAFITQGGLQSMEEAILDEVPFIGIPFFGDQASNVNKMVELGIGVGLDQKTLNKKNFKEAIIKVAEDESYHNNVARVSSQLTDFPMSGLERAVWWTEYVLRHGGARHLRAPAADVTWIEYFMLDVLGALVLIVLVAVFILYAVLKLLFRYVSTISSGAKSKTQ